MDIRLGFHPSIRGIELESSVELNTKLHIELATNIRYGAGHIKCNFYLKIYIRFKVKFELHALKEILNSLS